MIEPEEENARNRAYRDLEKENPSFEIVGWDEPFLFDSGWNAGVQYMRILHSIPIEPKEPTN